MFKWACLGVATVFLGSAGWMINDIRLQVRRSTEAAHQAASMVNESLPPIAARSKETTQVVATNLPQVVERVNRTTEVLAELAQDIKQLKQLLGVDNKVRDKNLVAYADSALSLIEKSGGIIGVKKVVGRGLKNTLPAAEWVAGERKEAFVMTLLVRSKKEMLQAIVKTKLGVTWYIEFPGKEPEPLLDWLKANHPETKNLE